MKKKNPPCDHGKRKTYCKACLIIYIESDYDPNLKAGGGLCKEHLKQLNICIICCHPSYFCSHRERYNRAMPL